MSKQQYSRLDLVRAISQNDQFSSHKPVTRSAPVSSGAGVIAMMLR